MLLLTILSLLISGVFAADCPGGSMEVTIEMMLENNPSKILGKSQGTLILDAENKVLKINGKDYDLHTLSMSETIFDSSKSINLRMQMTPETLVKIIKQSISKKLILDKAVSYNLKEIESYSTYFPRNPFIDLSSNYFTSPDYTEDDTEDFFYPGKAHGEYEEPYLVVKFNFSKTLKCLGAES